MDCAFKTANIETSEIDLFACARGPGSWTGLRIGFAAVKGFALALNKPYISIPTLDFIAQSHACFKGIVLPALDAKQKRYFCALYDNNIRISEYLDASPEEISTMIPPGKDVLITGNAAKSLIPELSPVTKNKIILDCCHRKARAEDILCYINHHPAILADREEVSSAPFYLRNAV